MVESASAPVIATVSIPAATPAESTGAGTTVIAGTDPVVATDAAATTTAVAPVPDTTPATVV